MRCLGLAALAAFSAMASPSLALTWNEAVDGDLANTLLTLEDGTNTLTGTRARTFVGTGPDDGDVIRFAVADDATIQSITYSYTAYRLTGAFIDYNARINVDFPALAVGGGRVDDPIIVSGSPVGFPVSGSVDVSTEIANAEAFGVSKDFTVQLLDEIGRAHV